MDQLAVKMLLADRGKLATALVGVVFAVVLMNVQGGLFLGLIRKASLLVDQGGADIWVGHRSMTNVDFPRDVPRRWVHRIRSVTGVQRAEPYLLGHSVMTLPSGGFEQVLIVGAESASPLGGASQLATGQLEDLMSPDAVFVDVGDLDKLEQPAIGDLREIGRRRARISGYTEGVLGFLVTPYVFTTLPRAAEYLQKPSDTASYFLVKVDPAADLHQVRRAIEARLPDAETMTGKHYAWVSIKYWLQRTGIGISFGAATGLGLLVGLIVVAQTLYASVLERIHEFATLKAIGASEGQLWTIVVGQALVIALVGSAVGLVMVGIAQALFDTPRSPIAVPWVLSVSSCAW